MIQKIRLSIVLFLFSVFGIFGQQEFGLAITKELCSEKYHGRGYVNDGHLKAAEFIKEKFIEFGLKPIQGDYFQPFEIAVNTFPNDISITIDNQKLVVGSDFIIDAMSGSADGTFTPIFINSEKDFFEFEFGPNDRSDKVLVIKSPSTKDIDTNEMYRMWKYKGSQLAPVIWLTDSKFTWTVGKSAMDFPIFEIRDSVFSSKISSDSKINIKVANEFKPNLKTNNVIGKIEGKCKKKTIVITAHYDHLGRMGNEAYFPGANDNASGTAMLLYLAKYYSQNKPPCNLVFMSFSAEEVGILGSKHYVKNPLFPLKDIRFLINLDILGTGEDGITVVNGAIYEKQFKKLTKINAKNNYLKKIKVRGKAANSDHYFFSEAGVPSFFIYTMGGVSYYHDVLDKAETLPLNEFDNLAKLLQDFIRKI
jgi:hypothetical protein